MRYFIDTEFIENGPSEPVRLISLGIVAEDGRWMYAINADCPLDRANEWVKRNVLPNLDLKDDFIYWAPMEKIRWQVLNFCDPEKYGKPEFWGYYADYDWVVFCQIFGCMVDLPKGWPMYCCDIKQWCDQLGNPKLPVQSSTEHNALNDARWNKQAWEFLHAMGRK